MSSASEKKIVVALMGPTATGKTQLAIEAVQSLPLEIISVDSAMVYRQMDIGTAKPNTEELRKAPHHLIDIVDPKDAYSCAQFVEDCLSLIADIHARKRIPFLVGGTMLYYSSLFNGLSTLPQSDPEIRRQLEEEAESRGWQYMHRRLEDVDPEAANRIHQNDPQRILRALEVYLISGESLSQLWRDNQPRPFPYPLTRIMLWPEDRENYKDIIGQRFHTMIQAGFEEEVKSLIKRGDLTTDLPSMRSVGYRQVWAYLQGEISREEMLDRGIFATRQLGKRQLTWLRKLQTDFKLKAYDPENKQILLKLLETQLN